MAAEISSQSDPDVPGLTAYIITGPTAQDVQLEINRLLWQFDTCPGEGHFRNPKRVGARYVSSGWTRTAVLS